MAVVSFTSNLHRHVPVREAQAHGATVAEVLDRVFAEHERLRGYVLDEQGGLRKHMGIVVDGTVLADRAKLSDPVKPDSRIYVLQALSGG